MKIATLAIVAACFAVASAVPPFVSILDPACTPDFPAILYDAADGFGIVAHNDFHGAGESGSVYHQYSFEGDACPGGAITLVGGVLTLQGQAYGGPAAEQGLTSFFYECTDVTGVAPGPIEANSCSGSYTHQPTNTTVTLTGKGRPGDMVELAIYEKWGIIRGEGWFTFPIGFDPNSMGAGDFVFKLGCGPFCGNGVREGDEACDPLDPANQANGIDCREDCTYCGDDAWQSEFEACDAGLPVGVDCRDDCTYCGDGEVNGDEGCEPGADENIPNCRDDCTRCGDGIVQEPEESCDYNDPTNEANGIECRGADGGVDDADCTYCGDAEIQFPETCEPSLDVNCDANCGIQQGPECIAEFDGVTCGEFNLINGPHGHGIFARGSFWPGNDYDPRPFTGGLFNYCPGSEMNFAGTFDNLLGDECEISYGCNNTVAVGPKQTTATECEGSMTCDGVTIAITGKSNGVTETDCWIKYDEDPWQCVSWFTFPDGAGGVVQGDLVWSGECPPESIGNGPGPTGP